jgi:type IV pilus assembly protein PilC
MPTYVFKGRNKLNEIVVGERVADSRDGLRQILRREQVTLTSVKEKGREIGIPKIGGRKKVKSKDLSIFTRQFSVMIDAGLPLVQCLEILAQQQILPTDSIAGPPGRRGRFNSVCGDGASSESFRSAVFQHG